MKGSIRFCVGFLVVFGAVGGLDNAVTNAQLGILIIAASLGLAIINSGVKAMVTK